MEICMKNPIEQLMDENCTDNIVLYNEKGEQCSFEQIAVIPMHQKTYAILRPAFDLPFMPEDVALVFVVDTTEDDEECLVVVEDDTTVDLVFAEYYRLLREAGVDVDDV